MMVAVARKPVETINGTPIYGLTRPQWSDLRITLARYFAWVDSGRTADPWASGVASSSRYDRIQVKHHKPSGGYDAGQCSEPEPDPALLELDGRIQSLPVHDRALLYWRIADRVRLADCAARLNQSADTTASRWTRLGVRMFYRIV